MTVRTGLVAVLVGVVVAWGCGEDGPTEPVEDGADFGENEWIYVMLTPEGAHRDLFRIRPDGTDRERVVRDGGYDRVLDFEVSPDRTEVALAVTTEVREGLRGFDIVVAAAEGGVAQRLTNQVDDPESEPGADEVSWSPDGDRMVVRVHDPSASEEYLGILTRATGELVALTPPEGPAVRFPAWSPRGDVIAYLAFSIEGMGPQVHLVAPDGSGGIRLSDTPAAEAVEWSPDGSRLAFAAWRDARAETDANLYVADADGSGYGLLLATSFERRNPRPLAWSPGGSRVAFTARNGAGDLDVFLMTAAGEDVSRVLGGPGEQGQVSFSPDGRWIVAPDEDGYLRLVGLEGQGSRRVYTGPGGAVGPSSPVWAELPGG